MTADTNREALRDEFRGDDAHLIRCIEALVRMNDDGVLRPHGIGGLARTLLSAAAVRLAQRPEPAAVGEVLIRVERCEGYEDVHPHIVADDFVSNRGSGFHWSLATRTGKEGA